MRSRQIRASPYLRENLMRYGNIITNKPLTPEVFKHNLFVGSMKKTAGALNFAGQALHNALTIQFPGLIYRTFRLQLKPATALMAALLWMSVAKAQNGPAIRLGPFEAQPRSVNPLREPINGGSHPTPVALDVDKDGDKDVVVAHLPASDGAYFDGFHYLKNVGTAAEPLFDRMRYQSNPFEYIVFSIGSTPAFSDLDEDGDNDMLIGSKDGAFRYYRNQGETSPPFKQETGAWNAATKTGNPLNGVYIGDYSSPAFADMDSDGDDDLVIGTSYLANNKSVHYYINDGAGNFTPGTLTGINPALAEVTPSFIDLDKDGNLDLLLGAADGKIYYYKRTGQTSFEEQTGAANPFNGISIGTNSSPSSADFDNDGDADVIVGTENNTTAGIFYFENKGNGAFEQKNGFDSPFDGVGTGSDSAPYFTDVDNDGDQDLLIGSDNNGLRYYTNVNGSYVEQVSNNPFAGLAIPGTFVPSFIDLDGDGDKDLAGSSFTGTTTKIEYYKNENGVFVHQLFSSGPFAALVIEEGKSDFADIDGDGDFDLFVSDVISETWDDVYFVRYFKNTGTAQSPMFTEVTGTNNLLAQVSENFVLAPRFNDIDHDGDLDVIIGEGGGVVELSDGNEFSYYENTGSATAPAFKYRGDLVEQGDNHYEPAPSFVDQDNDGDLDIFQGGLSGYVMYFRNMNPAAVATLNTTPRRALPGAGPVVIDAELLLTDADNDSIVSATVSIGGFQPGMETLVFTAQAGITGTFNTTTGVLSFRGKAPVQHYQSLLRTVALNYTGDLSSGRTQAVSRTITINVSDTDGTHSAPASRTITITSGEAPVFNNHTVSVVTRHAVTIDLATLMSDADSDIDVVTLAIVQQPEIGTTILNGTSLTIDYKSNFTGTETLVLQVCDATAACDQATITVNVTNIAPVIQTEPVSAPAGTTKTINMLAITSDADGNLDASTIQVVQPPSSGATATIEKASDTEVTLRLNYDGVSFSGTDHLVVKACDYAGVCTESILSIEVDVTATIEVFNAIAPNGNERNRYMHIANLPGINKVSIFNRWGDPVFVMNNYNSEVPGKRFEGNNDKGRSLESGTYFYTVEFTDQAQKRQTLTGYLILKQ